MNVTYLLGAGASSNCLPTYSNFRERFSSFAELLSDNRDLIHKLDDDYRSRANTLKIKIEKIKSEFNFHNTPDTIAKKYFHKTGTDKTDLKNLKEVIILFFIYEQTIINPELLKNKNKDIFDKRYDAFIASLLKPISSQRELLGQFKILTWNYDLQFEKAYSNYETYSLNILQKIIQGFPKIDGKSNYSDYQENRFSIVHLNGIAHAIPLKRLSSEMILDFHDDDFSAIKYLLDISKSIHTIQDEEFIGGEQLLSFAWENQNSDFSISDNPLIKHAINIAKQTEILVIIGYSFPMFNNPIDRELFNQMGKLKKVYIQSPQSSEIINVLKGDLLQKKNINDIVDLGYWHQFYIPNEWRKKEELYIPISLR